MTSHRAAGAATDVPDELLDGLTELSGLLLDAETLEQTLQRVVDLALRCVPGTSAAGITLLEGDRPTTAVASDPLVLAVDQRQYDVGDGPCLHAARTGELQRVDVHEARERWPDFSAGAEKVGIRSFLAAPLSAGDRRVGALNLYGRDAGAFDPGDEPIVTLLCRQTAVALANAAMYASARQLTEQLREAMRSRAVIEQAKGALMAAEGLDDEQAFAALREISQRDNRKLRDVAAEVVTRGRR